MEYIIALVMSLEDYTTAKLAGISIKKIKELKHSTYLCPNTKSMSVLYGMDTYGVCIKLSLPAGCTNVNNWILKTW